MRELRRHLHPSLAERWQRTLPLQRMRALLQDERHQQATRQAKEKDGEEQHNQTFFLAKKNRKAGAQFFFSCLSPLLFSLCCGHTFLPAAMTNRDRGEAD